MSDSWRLRRQREQLFIEQRGKCYWCGVKTVLQVATRDKKGCAPNTATIDHLFSRLSPDRGKVRGRVHVMACWKCNNERAAAEQASLSREELWRRSGSWPTSVLNPGD